MPISVALKVIVNCAMSADGKIALKTRKQTKISNEIDKKRVHELRNSVDGILVGIETIISDNPKLTVNGKYVKHPRHPTRIVLDSYGRTPLDAFVLDGKMKTYIVTNEKTKTRFQNAEMIRAGTDDVDLEKLMPMLERRGIKKLLVEGGSRVIWSFLNSKIADEVNIFVGSMVIGGEEAPTAAGGEGACDERSIVGLKLKGAKVLGNGILLTYKVVK